MTEEKIGARIRALRTAREMPQEELAELVGASQGQISGYERGVSYPPLKTLFRIAAVFETTVSEIVRDEG